MQENERILQFCKKAILLLLIYMLIVIGLSIVLVIIAFFLFSVRLLFVKGGEFRGSCASNNPMLQKEGVVCGVCGRVAGEPCGEDKLATTSKRQ